MRNAVLIARILLGLPLLVFGLNGFIGFIEQPEHTGAAAAFLGGLAQSEYLFPLKSGVEVLCGALLILGIGVPFALVLFAPILVNIVAFHVFLEPGFKESALGYGMLFFELFLAYAYAKHFRGVLNPIARSRYHEV